MHLFLSFLKNLTNLQTKQDFKIISNYIISIIETPNELSIIHLSNMQTFQQTPQITQINSSKPLPTITESQIMTSLNNNIDQLMSKIMMVHEYQYEPIKEIKSQPDIKLMNKNQDKTNRECLVQNAAKFSSNGIKLTGNINAADCQIKENVYGKSFSSLNNLNVNMNSLNSFNASSSSSSKNIQKNVQKGYQFKLKKKKSNPKIQESKAQSLFSSERLPGTTCNNLNTPILNKTLSSLFDTSVIRQVKKSNILSEIPASNFNQGEKDCILQLQSTIEQMSSSTIIQKSTESCQTQLSESSSQMGQPNFSLKDFHLGDEIGSGKYGDVYRCFHKKTNTVYALKKIFKSTIKEYKMQNQLALELKILYKLNHPNVIKLYAHFHDEYHVFLLMEYAHGEELMKKLKAKQEYISRVIDQVVEGVDYIHNQGILHRDIKPENIIMAFQNTVKICDFGWASLYNEKFMKTTFCGTLDYLSPEMKDRGQYTFTVDLWSIGILAYELYTGQAPFKDKSTGSGINGTKDAKNKRGPYSRESSYLNWNVVYPYEISGLGQTFIRNFLKENPDERASLQQIKNHIFLKKYREYQRNSQMYSVLS